MPKEYQQLSEFPTFEMIEDFIAIFPINSTDLKILTPILPQPLKH